MARSKFPPWDRKRNARPGLQERKRQFLAGEPMQPAPPLADDEPPEPPAESEEQKP